MEGYRPSAENLGVGPEANALAGPERLIGVEARRSHLERIRFEGILTEARQRNLEERERMIDAIALVGLPVDNVRVVAWQKNRRGRENWLASWEPKRERFTVYELNNRQVPEKQAEVIPHEGAHVNSPFDEANDELFDGRENRLKTAEHAMRVAGQSEATGKFMDGYHSYLYRKYQNGEITREHFYEETWAIMVGLALSNRKKLEQVQESQHKALDRMRNTGETPPEKVNLISSENENGEVDVDGVDVALINLLEGVDNYEELRAHVIHIREFFHSRDNFEVAMSRGGDYWEAWRKKKKQEEEEKMAKERARLEQIREMDTYHVVGTENTLPIWTAETGIVMGLNQIDNQPGNSQITTNPVSPEFKPTK